MSQLSGLCCVNQHLRSVYTYRIRAHLSVRLRQALFTRTDTELILNLA